MITFTTQDNGKQFISIVVTPSNTSIDCLINSIKAEYPSIEARNILFDESEILVPIEDGISYGFSLNELRQRIKSIANATVSYFAVDMDEPTQRYY